jgi:hypothetical protein
VYDVAEFGRAFDFVFFVGLLCHWKHAVQAVEAVSHVCTSTLLCESAIRPDNSQIPLIRHLRRRGPDAGGDARQPGSRHPNMAAMKSLFYESGFTQVDEVLREGGRGRVTARRRIELRLRHRSPGSRRNRRSCSACVARRCDPSREAEDGVHILLHDPKHGVERLERQPVALLEKFFLAQRASENCRTQDVRSRIAKRVGEGAGTSNSEKCQEDGKSSV